MGEGDMDDALGLDDCDECDNTGQGIPCGQCDGSWHSCHYCDRKPEGYKPAETDEAIDEFLKVHPLTEEEKKQVKASVASIKRRLLKQRETSARSKS